MITRSYPGTRCCFHVGVTLYLLLIVTLFQNTFLLSKLFNCNKTEPSRVNSTESLHRTSPKNLNDLEMSVRKPLLDQIDAKVDAEGEGVHNKVFEEEKSEPTKAANANSVHQVEVTADFHHN